MEKSSTFYVVAIAYNSVFGHSRYGGKHKSGRRGVKLGIHGGASCGGRLDCRV